MQIYVCFKRHVKRFWLLVGVLFEPEPAEKYCAKGNSSFSEMAKNIRLPGCKFANLAFFIKKMHKYLRMSKKSSTFAPAFNQESVILEKNGLLNRF